MSVHVILINKQRVWFPENDMSYSEFVYRKTTTQYSWTAGVHFLLVGSKGRTPKLIHLP